MKKARKKTRLSLDNWKIFKLVSKLLLAFLLASFFLQHGAVVFLIVFEILDLGKTILKKSFQFIPIDLMFIFGIAGSYFFSFLVGVIVFALGVFNRTIFLSIELRHISKGFRHLLLFFAITFLTALPFFTAALSMLVLNYIMKYAIGLAQGGLTVFEKGIFNLANFISCTFFFYMIHMIDIYLSLLL